MYVIVTQDVQTMFNYYAGSLRSFMVTSTEETQTASDQRGQVANFEESTMRELSYSSQSEPPRAHRTACFPARRRTMGSVLA